MRSHFDNGNGPVACGKNDHDLVFVQETSRVTCKACKYSKSFRKALSAQRKNAEKVTSSGLFPTTFWEKYIQKLPGKNAFPRGFN